MTRDDHVDPWDDPGGPAPDGPGSWLTPDGWQWDAQSLSMGEYVGFQLYLLLRDRLNQLRLPHETHDLLIQEMIDTHDVGLYTTGTGKSTMWYNSAVNDKILNIRIEGGDAWPDLHVGD